MPNGKVTWVLVAILVAATGWWMNKIDASVVLLGDRVHDLSRAIHSLAALEGRMANLERKIDMKEAEILTRLRSLEQKP